MDKPDGNPSSCAYNLLAELKVSEQNTAQLNKGPNPNTATSNPYPAKLMPSLKPHNNTKSTIVKLQKALANLLRKKETAVNMWPRPSEKTSEHSLLKHIWTRLLQN